MQHSINLDHHIPEVYEDGKGKRVIFDPARKKLIHHTPEELVRQRVIQFLIHEMKIPAINIETEVPLTRFNRGEKGRADIIIYTYITKDNSSDSEPEWLPLLVIECKAPHIPISQLAFDQVYRYNEIIWCSNVAVTNGEKIEIHSWDNESESYMHLTKIPDFQELNKANDLKLHLSPITYFNHIDFAEEYPDETIKHYFEGHLINKASTPHVKKLSVDLLRFLFKDSEYPALPKMEFSGITLLEDKLCPYRSYGNASGGSWKGSYRSLLIRSQTGETKLIEFSVLACKDPYTVLIVSIEDEFRQHNTLQLHMDRNVIDLGNGKVLITHDGKISVGNKGAFKNQEVLDFVHTRYPELEISENKLILGELDLNVSLSSKQASVIRLFQNLILYGLARDEFRNTKDPRHKNFSSVQNVD